MKKHRYINSIALILVCMALLFGGCTAHENKSSKEENEWNSSGEEKKDTSSMVDKKMADEIRPSITFENTGLKENYPLRISYSIPETGKNISFLIEADEGTVYVVKQDPLGIEFYWDNHMTLTYCESCPEGSHIVTGNPNYVTVILKEDEEIVGYSILLIYTTNPEAAPERRNYYGLVAESKMCLCENGSYKSNFTYEAEQEIRLKRENLPRIENPTAPMGESECLMTHVKDGRILVASPLSKMIDEYFIIREEILTWGINGKERVEDATQKFSDKLSAYTENPKVIEKEVAHMALVKQWEENDIYIKRLRMNIYIHKVEVLSANQYKLEISDGVSIDYTDETGKTNDYMSYGTAHIILVEKNSDGQWKILSDVYDDSDITGIQ